MSMLPALGAAARTAHAPAMLGVRMVASTPAARAAAVKQVAPKKKIALKKGQSGQRSTGGRRKGGVDSASSLAKASEHFKPAPDMTDLPQLDCTAIADGATGMPLAWTQRTLAAFEAFGLPRELVRQQAIQPRPRTVVRPASIEIVNALQRAAESGAAPAEHRLLVGSPGCGKSTYLLQALAHALESDWLVLFIPRVIDLVNSSSSFSYNAQQQTYLQPDITRDLLAAFHSVNKKVLGRVNSRDVVALDTQELPAGTPLDRVASAALASQVSAPARQTALEQVLLSAAYQTEVPMLVAVDDVQALFGPTWYRDPDFAPLQSYELAVPRALLSILLAAPKDAGIQRGAVLSAVSMMHSEFPPTPELLVALRDASGPVWKQVLRSFTSPTSPTRVQEPHAYTPMDEQHLINARTASFQPMDVGRKLMRSEAASLLELLHREHASWNVPNDEMFLAKLVESDGNIRVFERSLRNSLM